MIKLYTFLLITLFVCPIATSAQNLGESIRLSIAKAPRTTDREPSADKFTDVTVAVMKVPEAASDDFILAAVFEHEIGKDVVFRVRAENGSGRELSFLVVEMSVDKSCNSVLPFKKFSGEGFVNDREVPLTAVPPRSIKESELFVEDAPGVQRFAVLASPDAKKLQSVFMSVEFIAGLATGRSQPRAEALDELKLGQPKAKSEAFQEYSVGNQAITITLGSVYSESGEELRSAEYYDALMLIAGCRYQYDKASIPFDALRIGWLNNRALANYQIGELARAKSDYETALDLIEKLNSVDKKPRTHEKVVTMTNLAQVYATLGNQTSAIEKYKAAEKLAAELPYPVGDISLASIYSGLGTSLEFEGKFPEALGYYEKALPIVRNNRLGASEGILLNSLGRLAANAGKRVEAEKYFKNAISLSARMQNPAGIGSASNNLGYFYIQDKRYQDATNAFMRSSEIFAALGNRTAQATALGNLMFVERLKSNPQAAVFFGKRAISLLESVRGGLTTLEKQLQRSFLLSREETYRSLADILISLDRFLEAEKVIELLKDEEFSSSGRNRSTADGAVLPYTEAEAELSKKIDLIAQLRRDRDRLQAEKTRLGESFSDDAKLTSLEESIPEAAEAFRTTLAALAQTQQSVSQRVQEILGQRNLQATLSALKASHKTETVAIYTLIGTEDIKTATDARETRTKFGWAILVTPEFRKAYPIDVTGLDQTVMRFRQSVKTDRYDPKPEAIKLYNAIFRQTSARQTRTLEADLAEALSGSENKTVMWSLDGVLRYVPMAALNDGSKYLVEKYRNVVFTPQSLIQLQSTNNPRWTVLGLGVTKAHPPQFSELRGVNDELKFIVRPKMFEGSVLLDEQFTKKETLRMWRSGKYPVIHIATHFKFDPAQPERSFVLVGDGELRLADFNEDNIFGNVDLLALSACDTAMSSNGKESESFPYRAQDLGAKTVLASLWPVSDAGTPELMTRFYSLRAADPTITKGEAFHRAQVSLLRGETIPGLPSQVTSSRSEAFAGGGNADLPIFKRDERRPFAHPYYWAPFILIGNWR